MWLGKTRGVVLIHFQVLPRVSHIVQILYLLLLLLFFSHCSNPLSSVFTCQSLAQGVTNQMACQNRIKDPISASYGTSMTLTLQKIIFFLCCWGSHIKNALFSFSFLTLLLITTPTIIICKEKKNSLNLIWWFWSDYYTIFGSITQTPDKAITNYKALKNNVNTCLVLMHHPHFTYQT